MALISRLFSVCPRIGKRDGRLVASTAWRVRLMTLGLRIRTVTIDPDRRELVIAHRYFWMFTHRQWIRFKTVEAVTYGYVDWSLGSTWSFAHDSVDLFSVGLRLPGDNEQHLFYFFGDGTFQNNGPWPDWMYWDDYAFDMAGVQERESKGFATLLSQMVGVEIVPPRT